MMNKKFSMRANILHWEGDIEPHIKDEWDKKPPHYYNILTNTMMALFNVLVLLSFPQGN